MKKRIKSTHPVSTESRLREIERLAREQIASIKQDDPEKGSEESATLSLAILGVEPDLRRGTKVKEGATLGHESVHGSTEEKHQKWNNIHRAYHEVREAHPDWLEKQVDAEVMQRLELSNRTVRRHKPPRNN